MTNIHVCTTNHSLFCCSYHNFICLQTCENLTLISRVSNLSPAVMTEDHLKPEIPLIVTDAMTDWPAVDKFTVKFLDEVNTNVSLSHFANVVATFVKSGR